MQNKTSIEQLEELKAAAFLAKWQEQLIQLRDKDQRIAELEKLQDVLDTAPENIKNYFSKRTK